jgi:hypothetical protein
MDAISVRRAIEAGLEDRRAGSEEEAFAKAERRDREDEGDDEGDFAGLGSPHAGSSRGFAN